MKQANKKSPRATPEPSAAQDKFPARLHVLLASDAKVGLVIRRGPSKSVCTVLWNRDRDTFEPGQWMRGRIYERRCDLSPNGTRFIYFAMNGRWESETKGSWIAVWCGRLRASFVRHDWTGENCLVRNCFMISMT